MCLWPSPATPLSILKWSRRCSQNIDRGQVLPEQQRRPCLQMLQITPEVRCGVGDFGQDLCERRSRYNLRLKAELGQQERPKSRHKIEVQQSLDARAELWVDRASCRPVTHQAIGINVYGTVREDLHRGLGRVALNGLTSDLDRSATEVPCAPQCPLPQKRVLFPWGPARRVKGVDEFVDPSVSAQ